MKKQIMYVLLYYCPVKIYREIKLGLAPFEGASPFWLFCSRQTKKNNHEQK